MCMLNCFGLATSSSKHPAKPPHQQATQSQEQTDALNRALKGFEVRAEAMQTIEKKW